MIADQKKVEILSILKQMEQSLVDGSDEAGTIDKICTNAILESERLLTSNDALTPILRTALVINWRESAMKSRYERFRSLFPEVTTLSELKSIIENNNAMDFCKTYLDINPIPMAAGAQPQIYASQCVSERLFGIPTRI